MVEDYYKSWYESLKQSVLDALGEQRFNAVRDELIDNNCQSFNVMVYTAIRRLRAEAGDFDKKEGESTDDDS